MRPKTSFSGHVADPGDNALTLYALATAYADSKDPALRDAICKMVDHLPSTYNGPANWLPGFGIKSLMACVRELHYQPALEQAGSVVKSVFNEQRIFTPDNTFRHGGHMHGNLRTLVGAADYALYVKDPVLFSRVDALYRYVRSEGTIGNPRFRQYRYRVTWKGDTVVRMAPLGEQVTKGFSDFDGKNVEVFYGADGPGPLYQREQMMKDTDPTPASLHMDDGSLDFWFLR